MATTASGTSIAARTRSRRSSASGGYSGCGDPPVQAEHERRKAVGKSDRDDAERARRSASHMSAIVEGVAEPLTDTAAYRWVRKSRGGGRADDLARAHGLGELDFAGTSKTDGHQPESAESR
jgi:hypothetical protein